MSILIELPPTEEAQVVETANREGVSVEDLAKKAIRHYLPKNSPEPVNAATIALIQQWEEEDAKMTPEEREKDRQIFAEIEKNDIPRLNV